MRKFIGFIFILLLVFCLYKVSLKIVNEVSNHNKNVIEDIDYTKNAVATLNANTYINALNTSLELELFNSNIKDGEYKVSDNKIVNIENDNIFYEISYKGIFPSNESRIFLEDNKVKKAILYINGIKVEL